MSNDIHIQKPCSWQFLKLTNNIMRLKSNYIFPLFFQGGSKQTINKQAPRNVIDLQYIGKATVGSRWIRPHYGINYSSPTWVHIYRSSSNLALKGNHKQPQLMLLIHSINGVYHISFVLLHSGIVSPSANCSSQSHHFIIHR